jgi:protein-arginine kinase
LSYNKHLGYLTTDPKNLGTGLKISVRIKLPKLSKDGRLSSLLKMFNLSQHYRILNEPNTNQNSEETVESNSIVEVASSITLGKSEVSFSN